MAQFKLGIAVSGVTFNGSQRVLVGLAARLDQGYQQDEAKEE